MGKTIKELRKARNITQVQLAQRLGVTQSSIAQWETGRSKPSLKVLPFLALLLGTTVDEILRDAS